QKRSSCSFRVIFNEAVRIVRSENVSLRQLESLKDSLSVLTKSLSQKEPSGLYAFPGVSLLYDFVKEKMVANSKSLTTEIEELLAAKENYKATIQNRETHTHEERKRVEAILPEGAHSLINRHQGDTHKDEQLAITIARALEIREIYRNKHCVFTHATTAAF